MSTRTADADQDREYRLVLLGIGAIALAVRLLHVSSLRHALGDAQILDAAFYDDEARYLIGLLREPLDTASTRFANPGYSYALALMEARPIARIDRRERTLDPSSQAATPHE